MPRRQPRDHYHVYVVLLSERVWNEPAFRKCNPGHDSIDVPAFYIGGAGGALKTNTFVDLPAATNRALLKTLCRAMGVPDSASGHFGGTVLSEVLA